MSDLPEPLNRARAAAHNAARTTGPQNAIRATSPASPYARDRIEAPSNRPAPRTPTLRSRTQDVIRSAPGALTAARERSVYDTTPQDLVRGAQELTGLPSLARGAGALAALPALARSGFLGPQHALPAAGALAETALGLAGPMSLPRGAARVSRSVPLTQQYGSADTFESGPFSALYFNASPNRVNLLEMGTDSSARGQGHARRGMQEFLRSHGNRDIYLTPSPTEPPYDVARLEGFYRSLGFEPVPGDADMFAWRRLGANPAETAQRIPNMAREIGPNGMPIAQAQPTRNSFRGGSSDLREAAGRVAAPAADISRPISAGTLDGRTFYRGQGGDIQGGGSFRRNSHISANPETANNYATMNLSGAERAPTVFPLRGTGRIADRDGVMSVVDELVAGGMSREEALRQAIPELERRGFAGFQMARRGDPEFDDDIQIFNPSANLRSAFDAEPAQRIPNMAREIGPNGMPVAQSQPTRNSFRGGSSDLREAAGMRADLEAPPQVFEAFHNSPRGGIQRLRSNRSGSVQSHGRGVYLGTETPNDSWGQHAYRVQVRGRREDFPQMWSPLSSRDGLLERFQQAGQGRRVEFTPDMHVDNAYQRLADAMPGWTKKARELAASRALARAGVPGIAGDFTRPQIVVFDDGALSIVERAKGAPRHWRADTGALDDGIPPVSDYPVAPPPTTPTGTAPFGDPRAYPPQAWDDFGSPSSRTVRAYHGSPISLEGGRFRPGTSFAEQRDLAEYYQRRINPSGGRLYETDIDATGFPELLYNESSYFDDLARVQNSGVPGVRLLNVPDGYGLRNTSPQIRVFDASRVGEPREILQGGTPEARLRAQEQGFDTGRVLYHGTNRDGLFTEFREDLPTYLTPDPALASDFTGRNNGGVIPVFARTVRQYDAGSNSVISDDGIGKRPLFRRLQSEGFDSVRNRIPGMDAEEIVVFDPRNIRSIFAAFDPAKRDSSDLLASPLRGRTLGDDVQRLSAQVNDANVDPRLARDYDQALARGINSSVRDEILSLPTAATRETATYADRSRMMEPVNGDQFSVRVGPVPYGLQDGSVYAHHNHPMAGVPSDIVAPLSLEDLDFLRANRDVRGTFAHESGGGGSYAERGGRLGHRNARTALHRGVNAAGARMGDARGVESGEALLATGRAARRVGMLRRYGYRPSNADQAEALDAAAPNMSAAEWDALRAMHGPIYGLPYPLTWGRIGLATAGGTAVAGALSQQQNTTGRSNRRPSDSRRSRGAFDRTGR